MVLLRKVREVEVTGKCARHLLGAVQRPRRNELFSVALISTVFARPNHETSQILDVFEKTWPVIGHDSAQQVTEETNVAPEGSGDLLACGVAGFGAGPRQASVVRVGKLMAYSSESTSASNEASMMLLEQPTVVQRFRPLPDSMRTRVVAAVPASPSRIRTF